MFKDLIIGVLSIYYNLIKAIETNAFQICKVNAATVVEKKFDSFQPVHDIDLPRTYSQAIEDFEFLKVKFCYILSYFIKLFLLYVHI